MPPRTWDVASCLQCTPPQQQQVDVPWICRQRRLRPGGRVCRLATLQQHLCEALALFVVELCCLWQRLLYGCAATRRRWGQQQRRGAVSCRRGSSQRHRQRRREPVLLRLLLWLLWGRRLLGLLRLRRLLLLLLLL
jgi:hypothetical protein